MFYEFFAATMEVTAKLSRLKTHKTTTIHYDLISTEFEREKF